MRLEITVAKNRIHQTFFIAALGVLEHENKNTVRNRNFPQC